MCGRRWKSDVEEGGVGWSESRHVTSQDNNVSRARPNTSTPSNLHLHHIDIHFL